MGAFVCAQKKMHKNGPGKVHLKENKFCNKKIHILAFTKTNSLRDLRQIISCREPLLLSRTRR